MFVSPFTVSVSCDAVIIVIYLQRTGEFGGSSWFGIEAGHGFATEVVDLVSQTLSLTLVMHTAGWVPGLMLLLSSLSARCSRLLLCGFVCYLALFSTAAVEIMTSNFLSEKVLRAD